MPRDPTDDLLGDADDLDHAGSIEEQFLTPEQVAEAVDLGALYEGDQPHNWPVIPMRDVVVFPHMIVPLVLGRQGSLRALRKSRAEDTPVLLVTQRDPEVDDPGESDLFRVGTIARCLQLLELPDGTVRAVMEGLARATVLSLVQTDPYIVVDAEPVEELVEESSRTEAAKRSVLARFEEATELSRTIPPEMLITAMNVDGPGEVADIIASVIDLKVEQKQKLLEERDSIKRLQQVDGYLGHELNILRIEQEIHERVQDEMEDSQREYYLRERLRAIQDELGQREGIGSDAFEYRARIEAARLPEEARLKALEEAERLERMPMASPEVSTVRTYLDWLLELPWTQTTEDALDIERAARILDQDHYGLHKVKERVLEFLAVRQLVEEVKGPILCFIGPPGVGKTSIGRSIARALGREFIRISLGGVRDEAEIRGHRRTYVGALPGRVIQTLRRVGSNNPVFMIDEVDKIGADFRGDPSSALLEVLDPEQNHAFSDHYLEIPYDLSKVMFIATGNTLDTVPPALHDRFEVIEFPGYIEQEKMHIARDFLVPKQRQAHGLNGTHIRFHDSGLRSLVRYYTREAGVRNLEREIASLCRKVAREVVAAGNGNGQITEQAVEEMLGPRRFRYGLAREQPEVGVATGLAYTEAGGDMISIEVSVVEGSGELLLTGQLGEVMKESAQAALSYVRSHAASYGLNGDFFKSRDIHLHVPSGAVPKEGPSAGIAITTALVSAVSGRPVGNDLAMTGEVTLRGTVLGIGGVREKVLAAHRGGISRVILPAENEKDLGDKEEIPPEVFEDIEFVYVDHVEQALAVALV